MEFDTQKLPATPDVTAPDGADVRILLGLQGGGMAHFELHPGQTSKAVAHRTVEEVWFFLAGRGQMWRRQNGREEVVAVEPGVCLTIPLGTHFQFRALGDEPLAAIAVTMPPWPGGGRSLPSRGGVAGDCVRLGRVVMSLNTHAPAPASPDRRRLGHLAALEPRSQRVVLRRWRGCDSLYARTRSSACTAASRKPPAAFSPNSKASPSPRLG